MNLQLTHTTTAPAHSQFKKRSLAVAAGAVLMVTLVAGIGAWQTVSHSSTARKGSPTADVAGLVGLGAANITPPYTYYYYMVSSQEQADAVQASWDDALDQGYIQYEPPFHVQIVGSPEEEQQALADIIALDADAEVYTVPRTRVVDLRSSASSLAMP